MRFFSIPFHYLAWHYSRGIKDTWHTFTNILWFIVSFFSFGILFKTLFSPWQRLKEGYSRRKGLGDMLGSFFVNTLMRIVGFLVRISTIGIGLVIYVVVLFLGIIFLVFWFILPPLLLFFFVAGLLAVILDGRFDLTRDIV